MKCIFAILLWASVVAQSLAQAQNPAVFLKGDTDYKQRLEDHIDAVLDSTDDGATIVIWQVMSAYGVSVYWDYWSPQWDRWTGKPVGPVITIRTRI